MYEYYENYGHKIAKAQSSDAVVLPPDFEEKYYKVKSKTNVFNDIEDEQNKSYKPEKYADKAEMKNSDFDASVLEDEAAEVYEILKKAGRSVQADELAEMCGMDISEMLMVLTDLEIEGAVQSSAGNIYTAN